MKIGDVNKLLVGGLAALSVGLLLTLVCIPIYGWAEVDQSGVKATFSLWRVCVTVSGNEVCTKLNDPPSWLKTVRALIIIALLVCAVTVAITILFMVKTKMTGKSDSRNVTYGVIVSGGLTFFLQTIANIVYGAKYEDGLSDLGVNSGDLGAAFGLHIVASILVIAGALMVFFSYKKNKKVDGRIASQQKAAGVIGSRDRSLETTSSFALYLQRSLAPDGSVRVSSTVSQHFDKSHL